MAFTIVLDHPAPPGRSVGAVGLRGAGFVLLALTAVLGVPLFVLTIGGIVAIAAAWSDHPLLPDEWVAPAWIAWIATFILAAIARAVGERWARSNRRLVLFLRRFGHTQATAAISAATAHVGRSWRFVTLDDDQVSAVGVSAASRGFVRAYAAAIRFGTAVATAGEKVGSALGGLGFFGAIGSLLYLVAGGASDESDQLTDWSLPAGSTAVQIFRISVVMVGIVVAGMVAMLGFGVLVGVLGALFQPLAEARAAIDFADQHKELRASTEPRLDEIRGRIDMISRRVFSPRLYVVGVHSNIWQYAIRGFAANADLPLIDISQPTENILWEVRTLTYWFGPRCVVVGQYDQLGRLFDQPPAGSPTDRVMRLLDGVEVLGYTTDAAGQRRFVQALRHKLDHHARLPRPERAVT